MPNCATCFALAFVLAGCSSVPTPVADASVDANVGTDADASFDERVACNSLSAGATRPPCADGLICHIDNTCIERGAADEDGVTTLAVSNKRNGFGFGQTGGFFSGIGAIVATDDAVIWEDQGTSSPNNDPVSNASIQQLKLATGALTTLVSGLDNPNSSLFLDGSSLYYSSATHIRLVELDGSDHTDLPIRFQVGAAEGRVVAWIASSGFVYYARADRPAVVRYEVAGGEEVEVFSGDEGTEIASLSADAAQLFVETHTLEDSSTQLWRVDHAEVMAELLADPLRSFDATFGNGRIVVAGNSLLFMDGAALKALSIESGEARQLVVTGNFTELRSAHDGFAYYIIGETPNQTGRHLDIVRVAIEGGAPERLRRTDLDVREVVARDGVLYWSEDGKLLSMPLD